MRGYSTHQCAITPISKQTVRQSGFDPSRKTGWATVARDPYAALLRICLRDWGILDVPCCAVPPCGKQEANVPTPEVQ